MSQSLVNGSKVVLDYLGKWPSFHDFEVVSLSLERGEPIQETPPTANITFLGFNDEVSPDHPQRRNCFIKILFIGIRDFGMHHFEHQNPIGGMTMVEIPGLGADKSIRVDLLQVSKFQCSFTCDEISLSSIFPIS